MVVELHCLTLRETMRLSELNICLVSCKWESERRDEDAGGTMVL